MSKYSRQSVDLDNPSTSTTKIVELVPENSRVLDVGCSSGYLGEAFIKKRGARVWGIEIDPDDADQARQRGFERVFGGDLDSFDWNDLAGLEFDAIVFADVLEHLKRPATALGGAAQLLARSGQVIASIPNVAHLSLRVELMEGSFAYERLGLLDDTHLKYFTKQSILELFQSAGLAVESFDAVVSDLPEDLIEQRLEALGLKPTRQFWALMDSPEARAYQYIVVAGEGSATPVQINLPEKVVAAHARLVGELAETRARLAQIESSASYRFGSLARRAYRRIMPRLPA